LVNTTTDAGSKVQGLPAQLGVWTTLWQQSQDRLAGVADLSGKARQAVSRSSRPRPGLRWRRALLLSLALHGLALLGVARLPGHLPRPRLADTCVGHGAGVEIDESEPYTFLVTRAAARTPAPPPSPPPSAAIAKGPPSVPAPAPVFPPGEPRIKQEPGGFASAGRSPGPGRGGTTFFQIPTQAEKVVYVIDRSASMGLHGALDAARRELRASLERLPPTAHFQVIVYSLRAEPLLPSQPGWLAATAENKDLVAIALGVLPAEGSTHHDQALPRALGLQPDVIFFLTDADDLTQADVRAVTQRNRGRSVIHVVELSTAHRHRPDMPLQTLARDNGGVYQAVDLGGGQ
jgi:hypothetical protein